MELALEIGRYGGRSDIVFGAGGERQVFVSVPVDKVRPVRGRHGIRGLAIALTKEGQRPDTVRSILQTLRWDKAFLVTFLESCPAKRFKGEVQWDATWSAVARHASTEVSDMDGILRIAKCKALPWQIRLRLLDCLVDHCGVAAQVLLECGDPAVIFATPNNNDWLDGATAHMNRLVARGGLEAIEVAFAGADKEPWVRFGDWAWLRGHHQIVRVIEVLTGASIRR